MNQTLLNLHIQDTSDLKNIILSDISVYNPDLPVEDCIIEITVPNFSSTFLSPYQPSKANILNSAVLNWTTQESLSNLPDGLWKFRQSVKPNGLINREYNYFRVINLKSQILTKLSSTSCDKPEDWYKDGFMLIYKLDMIQHMVSCCGECDKAKIIYNSVINRFNSLNCDC